MSVTQCRTCDQPITFVLRDDGRWRPVEVTYQELSPEGSEMLAVQVNGSWKNVLGPIRVYSSHVCLDNPAWNQGRPSMRTGAVGQAEEPAEDDYVCTICGAVEDHDEDECPQSQKDWREEIHQKRRTYALRKMSQAMQYVLLHDCPECKTVKGEPCQSVSGWPIETVCRVRKLLVAFGEGQHWPPRHNQIGYRQMQDFLREHHTLFDLPPTPKEN